MSLLSIIAKPLKLYMELLQRLISIATVIFFGPLMGLAIAMAAKWMGLIAGWGLDGVDGDDFRKFIVCSGVITTLWAWLVAGLWLSGTLKA